jgi:pyruvate kinase
MDQKKTKIIVTLGPATRTEGDLRRIKDKGVDFVRTNMSHSSLADLEYFIQMSKKVGIPFIIDTEGSQIRTGDLDQDTIHFEENDRVVIRSEQIVGNKEELCLRPGKIIEQLQEGDLIHIDFDTLILRVSDVSTAAEGYVTTQAITGGFIGKNKAVVIDPALPAHFSVPSLSEKDLQSIQLGLRHGIEHIAVSFVRSGATVDEVREATQHRMKIISKVECVEALRNLDEIIEKSDYILLDRGDLSKEIPVAKIPFTQKIIIAKARKQQKGVFVATNLLETMVEKRKPTRAEVHDVISTISDGALGLTLAAETAIGKYPMECINMLNNLIRHAEQTFSTSPSRYYENRFIKSLEASNYLLDARATSPLVTPHGGTLVDRVLRDRPASEYLETLPQIKLDLNQQMDVEQIAIGTYSPLEGFVGRADFLSVLSDMRLVNGVVWPLPIVLDVGQDVADELSLGDKIALTDERKDVMAILHLEEKYSFDRQEMALKMYGTVDIGHPGVRTVNEMNPVLLAGKIDLLKRRGSATQAYELTPKQVRRLFDERGWAKVLGFHTRNVIHKGHEFIQLQAMEEENCDGLLVHPVIGKKKVGDFKPDYIVKSYETMINQFYPRNKVVFAAFATFSRYAGPREALFTALCRKNFGCSHFVVGRDHTGVGDYYDADASHRIFELFPDLGMKIVKFGEVFYSKTEKRYVHWNGTASPLGESDRLSISGSQARQMLQAGTMPPQWFMRPEIAAILVDAINNGEQLFESGN